MRNGEHTTPSREELHSAPVINSRYRVQKRLGRGGMGSVFLAVDTHRGGKKVALKRVRSDRIDDSILATLRNEFLSLAALRHPNIARVFDFGLECATRDIFFTSEFVEGPDWLKMSQQFDLTNEACMRSFLDLAVQVLRGLEFIHCCGLIHLDIKPENILVTKPSSQTGEDDASPTPKLIDFGLAKKEKGFGGKRIMGTTYYIAPETILGARVDRRTDLYSLGIVLYQLTTGQLPYRGESNLEVFKGHLEKIPTPPHEVAPSIPRQLSTIILCLMEKKPGDRFQSALEVIDEINRELGFQFSFETDDSMVSYLESARLIGREEELERLHSIFGQASKTEPLGLHAEIETGATPVGKRLLGDSDVIAPTVPSGRLIMLRGEKGLGKRRVIESLRQLAQTQGANVLEVECTDSSEQGGQDFFNFVRELITYASQATRGTRAHFAREAMALARRVKQDGEEAMDLEFLEALRSISKKLIERSRSHPFLLHFHDIHLAGRALVETIKCLVELMATQKVLGPRLLLTASSLDQADTEGTCLHELYESAIFRQSILEMRLERLDAEQVTRLVRAAFSGSEFAESFYRRVLEESDGNTEIVLDILGFFLGRRTICRVPAGWEITGDYEEGAIPGKVRLELKEKISSLPDAALRLAMAFAYLGDSTELELAVRVASIPGRSVDESIRTLRREKLLQERIEGDPNRVYTFVQPTARDILYRLVPDEERSAEHDRAGTLCEEYYKARGIQAPKKLAYHFLRGRRKEKGVRYGIEAAEAYVEEFLPLKAIETYEEVLDLVRWEDHNLANKLRQEIGGLRFHVGDYERSIEILESLMGEEDLPDGVASYCHVRLWLARVEGRLGHFERAAILTQEVISRQEEDGIPSVINELLLVCAELHGCKGNLVESLRCCDRLIGMRDKIQDAAVLSRLFMLLAESHFRLDNQVTAASYCQEALKLIDSQRETQYPDINLYCLAKYYKYKGKLLKAAKQFELSAQVSRKLGASDRRAESLLEMGSIHQWLERPQAALPVLQQAQALYTQSGNAPGIAETLCVLGEVHRLLGEYDESRKCLGDAFKNAEMLGNNRAKAQALLSYAGLCLDAGDLESAERYIRDADAKDVRVSGYVAQRMLNLWFNLSVHRGNIGEALDHAAKGLVASGQGEDRVVSAQLLAQRAILQCRLGRRMDARRGLVMLLDIARSYNFPLCEGRARLLEGMVLANERKLAAAQKSFTEATEVFRREGCERELVQVYLEHGLVNLKSEDFENTYLNLEEGFYLAKKLNLAYMKCRYYLAMGILELVIPEGQFTRAEERLRYAERLASQVPYTELLWQIRYYLGKLCAWSGRQEESEIHLSKSLAGRRKTTDSIPSTYRQGYLRAAADEDLENVLDRHLLGKQAATQGV